jgi:FkbM family methyltransferase
MTTNDGLLSILQSIGSKYTLGNLKLDVRYLSFLNLTFSIAGEDLWLRQYMKNKLKSGQPGFYVDLGAASPVVGSNTFLFYSYGWRGVCIDANIIFKQQYADHRSRDIFVNAAVSENAQKLYFAQHKKNQGMSKISASIEEFSSDYENPISIQTKTLLSVLEENVPDNVEIDFMSIDLEGSELSAIRSNNWSAYRPKAILIETHGINPSSPHEYPTVNFFLSQGYRYEGYANLNVLLVAN